ncbi:putative inorganic phosphate cotransporter [Agrilus planipennis]|uniref:Putative inorganic phosphate cotransporter n=1 Tax=Agrilus planipennis TaxID=224129 RepID=A0A1W4WJ07_AGRPL|nr:putative inorganic phosphate cotransporter [Agrilus planipennis]
MVNVLKVFTAENSELANPDKKEKNPEDETIRSNWYGVRHTQILLLFMLTNLAYGMRVNLSVAIVAMTDNSTNPNYDFPVYEWHDKSIILSSFFMGYIIPQVVAGQLAKKYGPKWFLLVTMAVGSLFSILIPTFARFGSWGVILCRIIQGFCQGFIFPSTHNLLGKWAPICERSRLGTFVFAGCSLGVVVSMILSGWISGSWLGWPTVFYLYGCLGLVWTLFWLILSSNSPAEHSRISDEEREYIESSLGNQANISETPTPWKKIFTSVPFWAILITHCAQNWGYFILLTELPTYMGHVLNFDIKSNGILSALPYLITWFLSFIFSSVADYLINRGITTIGGARKISNSIGLYSPAICLILLAFLSHGEETTALAVTLLVVGVGLNSGHMAGYQVNHIDLSPTHAGTLMGITNCMANICSLMGPLFVQYIVTDEKNLDQWKIVFSTSAAIFIIGGSTFILLGSGERQIWDSPPSVPNRRKSSTNSTR